MEYNLFRTILNKQIFESSKKDLLEKIAKYPDRYIGFLDQLNPKQKSYKIYCNLMKSVLVMQRIIVLMISLLFCLMPIKAFAAQSDFYGIWSCKIADNSDVVVMNITITINSFNIEVMLMENNKVTTTDGGTVEIISWIDTVNGDSETRDTFPNGVIIRTRYEENNNISSITILLSRDKKQFTISELNNDFKQILIFEKK